MNNPTTGPNGGHLASLEVAINLLLGEAVAYGFIHVHEDCGCDSSAAYLRGLEEGDAAGYERGLEEAREGGGFGTA